MEILNDIFVVGIGPGAYEMMTGEAVQILSRCDVIIGYTVYADILRKYFPDKDYRVTPMKQEAERCRLSYREAAAGKTVALVCSGDAGIYGMAGLLYELLPEFPEAGKENIHVIPGITAAISGAALLGAPLAADFAVISLSDLLVPWEIIEKRLSAAAMSDFVICLYNPGSHNRKDYLSRACGIVLTYRGPETVCGIARNIGRDGQESEVLPLGELKDRPADMFSIIYIGSSRTVNISGKMVTKRGYRL